MDSHRLKASESKGHDPLLSVVEGARRKVPGTCTLLPSLPPTHTYSLEAFWFAPCQKSSVQANHFLWHSEALVGKG